MTTPQEARAGARDFILQEWQRPAAEAAVEAASRIAALYGDAALGTLFYGSCLRTGEIEDKILDFYVIVSDYAAAYKSRFLAVANKLIPPNVFYHEFNHGGMIVRSKYAVLSLADLEYRTGRSCLNVSVWARFSQPTLLLSAKDDASRDRIAAAIAEASVTMLEAAKPLIESAAPRDWWVAAFEATYAAELRSEKPGKGLELYLLDQERYDRFTPSLAGVIAADGIPMPHSPGFLWARRRWNGKVVSFLRLVKASMTFDGGIDYLAWKIRRHSGVEIEVTDWMRRHPVLAGISLFWSLRKKGAFK
ncbi:hypothetical protein [Gimibacter soli]|uniref:Phosphatidate cytidylyltransferase n=1 Tax=Gimibacter soli TaxID=3024400 RepID=A0AAF0BJK5_9PROT|nr:hypothetical protein [Gimibacter soli]WCL53219.1 hypothetical protein PH603_11805 [Gimibacter soli]